MQLEKAKKVAWEWLSFVTEEQRIATKILLLEIEKIQQLEKENSELTSLISELSKIVEEWVQLKSEGRLLELPCKVGDTVYEVSGSEIYEMIVVSFEIDKDCICVYLSEDKDYGADGYDLTDFGVSVFLNEADARNALEGFK